MSSNKLKISTEEDRISFAVGVLKTAGNDFLYLGFKYFVNLVNFNCYEFKSPLSLIEIF